MPSNVMYFYVRHYELDPFGILVLCVERTLCEKVMGLVRSGMKRIRSRTFDAESDISTTSS